jgi:single-strand DNA-binding protein
MLNLNRVEVIGNLTRDPELRYTPSNQAVTSFAIATNRRYKDQSGNWVDSPPEYHDVVIWGQVGERCNQVLHKGDRVFVTGRLQTRSWEAPDGQKKYKTEIVADTIIGPDLVNKNLALLKRYTNEFGQIESRRRSGNAPATQRMITTAIKRARHLALLPFVKR